MSLRSFGARICSRAGAGSVALAHAPPSLREHLSSAAVGRLLKPEKVGRLLHTVELREAAEGMEKGLGIGADTIELLHRHNGRRRLVNGDPTTTTTWDTITVATGHVVTLTYSRRFGQSADSVHDIHAALSSWRGIKRGKELFVTGLRNFDIPAAYAGLHELKERVAQKLSLIASVSSTKRLAGIGPATASRLEAAGVSSVGALASLHGDAFDQVLASTPARLSRERLELFISRAVEATCFSPSSLGLWIFSVRALQAFGHFPALARDNPDALKHVEAVLALGAGSPQRQHLVTHSTWWDDGENANALYELVAPGSNWPAGGETLPPPTLLRRMRESAALRRLGPDVHFSHLDAVKDPRPADGDASLRVLRSSHEIERVGKELRNCLPTRSFSGTYLLSSVYVRYPLGSCVSLLRQL